MGSDISDLISFEPPGDVLVPGVAILTPRPGRPIVGIALADKLATVLTHWHNNRTMPCTRQRGACVCSEEPLAYPVRPKFFLAIYLPYTRQVALLQLSPSGARSVQQALPGDRIGLRGSWIEARRVGAHANSTQAVRISDDPLPEGLVLPEACDVAAALRRVYFGQ